MKGGGTKHIVLLYVNVAKGTWVTVSTSFSPVPFAFVLPRPDLQRVAAGVATGGRFSTFSSSLMVEHSQRTSAVGRVISFDSVILSESTTIPYACALNPKRQMSFILDYLICWDRFVDCLKDC
jgi:hypothetical protein